MNDDFVDKKGIRWNPKEMLNKLAKELELSDAMYKVAVRERDYERTLCDQYKFDLQVLRNQIDKFEEDIKASLSYGDIGEDERGTELMLDFIRKCRML